VLIAAHPELGVAHLDKGELFAGRRHGLLGGKSGAQAPEEE
jgi:hypothetical protein